MDGAALAGLCALLAHGAAQSGPATADCRQGHPPSVIAGAPAAGRGGGFNAPQVAALVSGDDARDGIARVAFAEAANQGDSGLAAVVYTILNRLDDGRWGGSIDAVLNASHQFEPVMRAGGSWRNLPPVSGVRRARIDTIINLALEGRLPDLTHGARFFQNPRIVADRAASGQVSAGLVNFGGAAPSAVIGAHSFYVETGRGGGSRVRSRRAAIGHVGAPDVGLRTGGGAIFVAENRPPNEPALRLDQDAGPPLKAAALAIVGPTDAVPEGPMFVRSGDRGAANWR